MIARIVCRWLAPSLAAAVLVAGCADSASTPVVEPTVSIPPRSSALTDDAIDHAAGAESSSFEVAPAPAELAAAIDELVAGPDGGAVFALRVADGPVYLHASGTEPDGTPLLADAAVRVGSISKVVTATLVFDLVEEGLIDLDATVASILPDTPVGGEATVRQLLAHQSGIPNYTENPGFFSAALRRPSRSVTPEQIIGFADGDALFEPGTMFAYSNTNYVLLGQIIEAVTAQSLNDVFDERIGEPLGLTATSFDLGDRLDVASGHTTAVPGGSTDFDYTSVASSAWAAGSLVTTVEELARIATALFDGELIRPGSVAAMRTPIDAGQDYGLGLHGGPDFGIGHGGAILGFNSLLQIDPESGDLLVMVVNNDLRRPEALSDSVWEAATTS